MKRIMPDTGEFFIALHPEGAATGRFCSSGKNNRIKMYKNTYIMNNTSKIRKNIHFTP